MFLYNVWRRKQFQPHKRICKKKKSFQKKKYNLFKNPLNELCLFASFISLPPELKVARK